MSVAIATRDVRIVTIKGHTHGHLMSYDGSELVARLVDGRWKPSHVQYPLTHERMAYRPLPRPFELSHSAIARLDRAYVLQEALDGPA